MKNIWLVGASSGIGAALAKKLAESDARVFISARSVEALSSLAEDYPQLIPVALDVCDDWSVTAAVKLIREHTPVLDQVIINAGTCEYVDAQEIDMNAVKQVMDTNFFGALNIVNASLPLLRASLQRRREFGLVESDLPAPQLVFMSSSVTYQAMPRAGAYGASKAAIRYFAESLKIDLQREGIDIRVISPGFVKTPLTDRNDFPMPCLISAAEAAEEIVKGLASSSFDIAFPKRFTRLLKLIHSLPDNSRFRLLGKSSRHVSSS